MTMRASVPSPSLDSRPELSLVFPAFDEAKNLGPLLDRALEIAHGLARRFEIIVVDDGSRDGSARLVAARAAEHDQIRLIRHPDNRGYGAALRAGLREARGDLVFFSDADLQFDLAELALLIEHARDFDVVAGYRAPRRDPWGRRLLARCWGMLVRTLFDLPVRDIDCAFKLFRRPVLQALPISSLSAFVNTEILVRARSAGFRLHQVPVSHNPRQHGRQSGANPRVIVRALRELVLLYAELRRPRIDPALLRDAEEA
jgi:glycosyltransferase involved in cell wall biosynthesis